MCTGISCRAGENPDHQDHPGVLAQWPGMGTEHFRQVPRSCCCCRSQGHMLTSSCRMVVLASGRGRAKVPVCSSQRCRGWRELQLWMSERAVGQQFEEESPTTARHLIPLHTTPWEAERAQVSQQDSPSPLYCSCDIATYPRPHLQTRPRAGSLKPWGVLGSGEKPSPGLFPTAASR